MMDIDRYIMDKGKAWWIRSKGEFGFWLMHSLTSIAPFLVFVVSVGSGKSLVITVFTILLVIVLFAVGCTMVAFRFGGFSKSRFLFPRALRIVLYLRMTMVGLLLVFCAIGQIGLKITGLLVVFGAPDMMCVIGSWRIYDRLADNVTIKGNAALVAMHPFLSALVSTSILVLIWSSVFLVLSLLTAIPLRIRDVVAARAAPGL